MDTRRKTTQYIRIPAQLTLVASACAHALACAADASQGGAGATASSAAVRVIGTSDRIAAIRDVMPGSDGTIWALNSVDPYFIGFDADGAVVHAWGVQGQGPGEFGAPDAFARHPGTGNVWVYDRADARNAFVRIDAPGGEWQEVTLSRDSVPARSLLYPHFAYGAVARVWIASAGDGFYVARARPGYNEVLRLWHADIVEIDPTAGSFTNVLPVDDLLDDPASRYAQSFMLLPYPLWDVCAANRSFVVYDPLRNAVRLFDASGAEEQPIELPPERAVEVTMESVLGMVVATIDNSGAAGSLPDSTLLRSQFEAQWREISAQFADVFPEYVDLRCLEDGSIWIQPFDSEGGRLGLGNRWMRFDRDGTRAEISLPESFFAIRFTSERIWGTVSDELGVQSVAWMPLPGR